MGRLGHTLSTLRPVGHPTRTQDSLPVVGQTLPGGLSAHWVPPKGFFDASYFASPFPRLTLAQARSGPPRLWTHRESANLHRPHRPKERIHVLSLEEMLVQSSSTTLAGLGGDAKSDVTKEEAKTFADQLVAALAAAVKRGAAVPSELREPDQGAVCGRAVAGEEVNDGSSADWGRDSVQEVVSQVRLYLLDQISSVSSIPILTGRWTLLTRSATKPVGPASRRAAGRKGRPNQPPELAMMPLFVRPQITAILASILAR
jgi:hypothetical protein